MLVLYNHRISWIELDYQIIRIRLPSGQQTVRDIENGPVEIVKIYPATKKGGSFPSVLC